MTKRDFFKLIIKLFGLLSIITSLFSIFPSFFSFGLYGFDTKTTLAMITAIIIVLALFVVLIFKSDKIIDFLDLDKGFDDDKIDLKELSANHIIQLGVIIIGGLLVLENIAAVISHAYFALRTDLISEPYSTRNKLDWAVSSINLVIGYLLLTNHLKVANYLFRPKPK